ncbi:YhcH/YjgK/YiaL family protein [Acetonema longum]|uniref:YhcH/YjgK/YiaL family protein n=1 Tax=Acetonema longum DSM 6540 TaxID=1009370 RepID=F7NEH2_9FIRM|nr:YhcH/YjgK/YiaL family protein [Acetonema longum]EGO65383.1 hypothetical protein ALO_02176 [Acetonema longum DSM 6540]
MIQGDMKNLDQELFLFHPLLQKGLQYLKNTDFSKLAAGRYEIDGDILFALVQEYEPQPKQDRKAETHAKYADVQYVAQGQECIGFARLTPDCEVAEDKLAEKDAVFYKTVKDEVDLVLDAGSYAVFMPADVHRPCCLGPAGRVQVKKVVLKVKVSVLK